MSAASLPYHLRPHKAVDRRLFVDLLSRAERWAPLSEAVYISMGAYPLEDHKLVHRLLGLRNLIAFDMDEHIVRRQKFNRPINSCKCMCYSSDALIADLYTILAEHGYPEPLNLIVWLDYTAPAQIGDQIREFQALIDKLKPGDIVRVTVNAHAAALFAHKSAPGVPQPTAAEVCQKRFEKLEERIGDYLPSTVSPEMMVDEKLPQVLSLAFSQAVLNSFPPSVEDTFAPLSIVRYKDGQQMLSLAGIVIKKSDEEEMQKRMGLADWRFASTNWSTIHRLAVPDLTLRERLLLERVIGTAPLEEIKRKLGFDFAELDVGDEFLQSYEHYYRFYPSLLSAEL